MKRLVISTFVVLATLGGLLLLWQFRQALMLFVFSLVVAAMARPATDYFAQRGLGRGLAILLTYLISLALLGGLLAWIGGPLLAELQQVTDRLADAYSQLMASWPHGTAFQQQVASRLPPPDQLYKAISGEQGTSFLTTAFGFAQSFLDILSQVIIVLVLSIYWTADQVRFERLWLSLLPSRQRSRAREIWRSIELGVGAYLRSEIIQSILAGLLLGIGYQLMGLQYPVLLAVSSALFWLIPWLGAMLAVVFPLATGLLASPLLGLAGAIYTLVVLLVLEVVVEPRIFNRRRYSSLLIILFVVALADQYGLIGIIIAPPLAAATQIFFRRLTLQTPPVETVSPATQVATLQTRLEALRSEIDSMEEPPTPEITNLVARIDELMQKTNDYLRTEVDETPSLGLPIASQATSSR